MSAGTLYLCATPIGNLDDMTFRAIKILREVDLIAAEDTRHTRKLLTHFDIHTPLIRCDEFSEETAGKKISEMLLSGKSVACVSDAGLPAISDPGAKLVKLAINSGIKVCPIPGANAALSALICSGLDTKNFTFAGFLPKTGKNRREVLQKFSSREETLIFYEAPHRLQKTLKDLAEFFGERQAVLARELTKIHEEFLRGTLSELAENPGEIRGEFVIVVEGKIFDGDEKNSGEEKNFLDAYEEFIQSGIEKKIAIRETAKKFNLPRREVYNAIIDREG